MIITYFLKASIKVTIFSYLSVLSILTSLKVVFLTISSSSDSLNFLIATISPLSLFLALYTIPYAPSPTIP